MHTISSQAQGERQEWINKLVCERIGKIQHTSNSFMDINSATALLRIDKEKCVRSLTENIQGHFSVNNF